MSIASELTEIRIKGRNRLVPSVQVDGERVIVVGGWLKVARVHDEDWKEGDVVRAPKAFIDAIRRASDLKADVFTFSQKIPDSEPRHPYLVEPDNLAVIRTANFQEWWEKSLPQVTRKNVRRAGRRGVVVKTVECDEALIKGITEIYNEIPIRDGRPFPHYGKSLDTIRREVSTMPDRSQFIAAFYQDEIIGFIKLIHMGRLASILHIVSKQAHYDKRPANALIAKAAEVCNQRRVEFLIYGQYSYGNRTNSPLTEFKRRNGFEPMVVPRYFVPLSLRGELALKMGLHRGVTGMLPSWLVDRLLRIRAKYYERRLARFVTAKNSDLDVAEPGDQQ